ncbi:ATP-dependent DNA helicase [Alteromonas phage vB_AmeP_PT11-V19]|nr:ATP-dependent DNA helicase [Alteromonas phage vB_AmeP_PT11-V19]
MLRYTPEQADALDHILEVDGILLIEAGAGTGKTFMAKQFIEHLKPRKALYTAFNKAIVEEGKEKFKGLPIDSKTFHALAYSYVRPNKIQDLSYREIKEPLNYSNKRYIITAIDMFFVSSSTDMYEFFEKHFYEHPKCEFMVETSAKYVNKMAERDIPMTFNFMLKFLHLALAGGDTSIDVDLVILDEINDVTAVSLEIFKLINAPKKIGLGETHQAIYQFLNLVNGFEELADVATTMRFTQSYRCGEQIALRIQNAMQTHLDPNFKFVGTDEPVKNGKTLFCTNTNSAIVGQIYKRLKESKGFKLLRDPKEIFAAPLAVSTAAQGKEPYQKKYHYLVDAFEEYKQENKYKSFYEYLSKVVNDEEINNAVKLLVQFANQGVNLFEVYKQAKEALVDETFVISTVFTAKGLEYETVYLSDDINTYYLKAIRGELEGQEAITAMRCYYVACSRAGCNLRNSVLREDV